MTGCYQDDKLTGYMQLQGAGLRSGHLIAIPKNPGLCFPCLKEVWLNATHIQEGFDLG